MRDNRPIALEPTSKSRSWLWPAIALVVLLAAIVALGRLGQAPPTVALASPTAGVTTNPTTRPSLTVVRQPVYGVADGLIGAPTGIRGDGQRYDDGVPTALIGQSVVRVRDAAALPLDTSVVVGGWERRADCVPSSGSNPCPVVLSDVPYRSGRAAVLPVVGQIDVTGWSEPRIYSAVVEADPSCTLSSAGACLPRLLVDAQLWIGDDQTATAPLGAPAVLDALASRFARYDFLPFEEAGSCPVVWPVQSYVASAPEVPRADWPGLPVRLVVVFATAQERATREVALRAAAAKMTPFDASNRCVSIPGGVDDNAWVVRDNVMVLLGPDDAGVRLEVEDALDASASSGS